MINIFKNKSKQKDKNEQILPNDNDSINESNVKTKDQTKVDNKSVIEPKTVNDDVNSPTSKYDNVNFGAFSREKMFSVIVELIRENKLLLQENEKLNCELKDAIATTKTQRQSVKDISDRIDYIALKIYPPLITTLNDGQKMTLDAKIATIISGVNNEKRKFLSQILELNEKVKMQKTILEELKSQLAERIEEDNINSQSNETKEFKESEIDNLLKNNICTSEAVSINGSIALKPISINKARNVIDEVSTKIMEGLGKKGLSEYPELLEYCIKNDNNITESKFETAIDNLQKTSVIDISVVSTIKRNRGVRIVSLSSEVGKKLYAEIFREKCVLSEKEKMTRENDNLAHGYSIKDVKGQLETFGYTDISMDRIDNTINISGSNTWIPDIIAINPVSGLKEYYEIEMGTHNQENFSHKLDKANLKATSLKIIVPNRQIKDVIFRKIENWNAQNPKKIRSITIYVLTFNEFKNKQDGSVFNQKLSKSNDTSLLKEEIIKNIKEENNVSNDEKPSKNINNNNFDNKRNNENKNLNKNNNFQKIDKKRINKTPVSPNDVDIEEDV